MPECQLALHQQLGENLGIFHRPQELCFILGDTELPKGLEVALALHKF